MPVVLILNFSIIEVHILDVEFGQFICQLSLVIPQLFNQLIFLQDSFLESSDFIFVVTIRDSQ